MPHHRFFTLTGHKNNASFAQALPPWCRIYWFHHRHDRSNEIILKPIKIRQQDSKHVLKCWIIKASEVAAPLHNLFRFHRPAEKVCVYVWYICTYQYLKDLNIYFSELFMINILKMWSHTQNYEHDSDMKALLPPHDIFIETLFETERGHIGIYAFLDEACLAQSTVTTACMHAFIHSSIHSFTLHFVSICYCQILC